MLTYSNTNIYFAAAAKTIHIESNYADYASSIKKNTNDDDDDRLTAFDPGQPG